MAEPDTSFRDLEHQGWSAQDIVTEYHDHLSPLTTQAVKAVLAAAEVRRGARVVNVATGPGGMTRAGVRRKVQREEETNLRQPNPLQQPLLRSESGQSGGLLGSRIYGQPPRTAA